MWRKNNMKKYDELPIEEKNKMLFDVAKDLAEINTKLNQEIDELNFEKFMLVENNKIYSRHNYILWFSVFSVFLLGMYIGSH